MKPAYLLLLRHAEKARGFGDTGLTDDGRRQASELANEIALWVPHQVVSSTLVRARETASIIAGRLSVTADECAELVERRVETAAGGGRDEFREEWSRVDADRDYVPYNGESSRMAGARLSNALRRIAARADGSRIAVVTHGGIIRDFVLNVEEACVNPRFLNHSLSGGDIPLVSGTLVSLSQAGFTVLAVGVMGDKLRRELRAHG